MSDVEKICETCKWHERDKNSVWDNDWFCRCPDSGYYDCNTSGYCNSHAVFVQQCPEWEHGVTKIGELTQHCGECEVIDFCGSIDYSLCGDGRFADMEQMEYVAIAVHAPSSCSHYSLCGNCEADDCSGCDYNEEARDAFSEKVADYVYETINPEGD